jgi:hypothetical protein
MISLLIKKNTNPWLAKVCILSLTWFYISQIFTACSKEAILSSLAGINS